MGRKSRSGISSGGAGNTNAPSAGSSFMSNQRNMEDYAVAVGMFDRDFMRTEEGQQALREFMDGEREAGLTEQDMREAIRSTGSRSRGSNSGGSSSGGQRSSGGGGLYKESDIPSRANSFTVAGTGVSGDYESKTYVTKKGDGIKTVTKYSDGTKMTHTDMKNYGDKYDRSRAEYESILARMAKAHIRTGSKVTAVDDKKKGR